MNRQLEPSLPGPPDVTDNPYGGNAPGPGLKKQPGADKEKAPPGPSPIPMGDVLPNAPGKGLGKTDSDNKK
jgi:hypothetical protein